MSNDDVDSMTETELAEHLHRHRDDLAGEEVGSRAPTRLDVMISARFSREEAAALRAAAEDAGMSLSAYLRALLWSVLPKCRTPSEALQRRGNAL